MCMDWNAPNRYVRILTYFALRPFQIESVVGNFVAILQLANLVVASPETGFLALIIFYSIILAY